MKKAGNLSHGSQPLFRSSNEVCHQIILTDLQRRQSRTHNRVFCYAYLTNISWSSHRWSAAVQPAEQISAAIHILIFCNFDQREAGLANLECAQQKAPAVSGNQAESSLKQNFGQTNAFLKLGYQALFYASEFQHRTELKHSLRCLYLSLFL